jgi:hypothetical protein
VGEKRRILEIFVMPLCFGCQIAEDMARRIRSHHLSNVDVRLIDLSDPTVTRPDSVFAVPTYQINGRVICLGNPEEPWLLALLEADVAV